MIIEREYNIMLLGIHFVLFLQKSSSNKCDVSFGYWRESTKTSCRESLAVRYAIRCRSPIELFKDALKSRVCHKRSTQPITFTVHYSNADIMGQLENTKYSICYQWYGTDCDFTKLYDGFFYKIEIIISFILDEMGRLGNGFVCLGWGGGW